MWSMTQTLGADASTSLSGLTQPAGIECVWWRSNQEADLHSVSACWLAQHRTTDCSTPTLHGVRLIYSWAYGANVSEGRHNNSRTTTIDDELANIFLSLVSVLLKTRVDPSTCFHNPSCKHFIRKGWGGEHHSGARRTVAVRLWLRLGWPAATLREASS